MAIPKKRIKFNRKKRRKMSIEYYRELYQERAGIMEFDGKLSRIEAEKKALSEITSFWLNKVKLNMSEPKTYNIIEKFKKEVVK